MDPSAAEVLLNNNESLSLSHYVFLKCNQSRIVCCHHERIATQCAQPPSESNARNRGVGGPLAPVSPPDAEHLDKPLVCEIEIILCDLTTFNVIPPVA